MKISPTCKKVTAPYLVNQPTNLCKSYSEFHFHLSFPSIQIQNEFNAGEFSSRIKDIRLMKHRDSGNSRGFGFIEFMDLSSATDFMEKYRGEYLLNDKWRLELKYSTSRANNAGRGHDLHADAGGSTGGDADADWICTKCDGRNFRRRVNCFKCGLPRRESTRYVSQDGAEEVGTTPSTTLLLRGLDALSQEDSILLALQEMFAPNPVQIVNCKVLRDSLTNTSRGFAAVEFESLRDAQSLFTILGNRNLIIDQKRVLVNYSKSPFRAVASGLVSSHNSQTVSSSGNYAAAAAAAAAANINSVPNVAPNSLATAAVLASAAMAQAQSWPVALGIVPSFPLISIPQPQPLPLLVQQQQQQQIQQSLAAGRVAGVNALAAGAAASANSALVQQPLPRQEPQPVDLKTLGQPQADGSYRKFPAPDTNSFQFDDSSGFYYDPSTTLYYDANSQYFYNSVTTKYYFWSEEHSTYLLAPGNDAAKKEGDKSEEAADNKDGAASLAAEKKKGDAVTGSGKTKKASDIAKDMERWAKRQNKEKAKTAKQSLNNAAAAAASMALQESKTADAGFAALEKRMDPAEDKALLETLQKQKQMQMERAAAASATQMIASYGGDSDEEEGGAPDAAAAAKEENAEEKYVDFVKMACLLCKRQFGSKEQLTKHTQLSDLHKENLRKVLPPAPTTPRPAPASVPGGGAGSGYRDRAQERRDKFGAPEPPMGGRIGRGGNMKPTPAAAAPVPYQQPTAQGIQADNRGNQLLKNMG